MDAYFAASAEEAIDLLNGKYPRVDPTPSGEVTELKQQISEMSVQMAEMKQQMTEMMNMMQLLVQPAVGGSRAMRDPPGAVAKKVTPINPKNASNYQAPLTLAKP